MKPYAIYAFLALTVWSADLKAQTQAVTNTGETVTLFENGTWEYTNKKVKQREELLNSTPFLKQSEATFLVKSKRTGFAVYIDPLKWKFEKKDAYDTDESEYEFNISSGDVYALMITERAELSFELLKKASLINASKVAPDAAIINEEYRMVNGNKVLMLQLKGTMEGLSFTYFGYYVTGESGTVQLITFTTSKLFPEKKKEMEKFLNGITIQPTTTPAVKI
jgi:hypothetical protein